MERRGEQTGRGDINRQAQAVNTLIEERNAVEAEIAQEQEKLSNPPATPEDARERIDVAVSPLENAIRTEGHIPDIQGDGLTWWQRAASHISTKARSLAQAIASKTKALWQDRFGSKNSDHRQPRELRSPEPERQPDDDRGLEL